MLDALRRASAKRITAVIPYFGYSRQDRKHGAREPITAKLVADIISIAGCSRILFLDLHADQIQGFFNVPVDNLLPDSLFVDYMKEKGFNHENTVVVSPDVGGAKRARRLASYLNLKIALLENREIDNTSHVNVVGELAENAIIVDDMIDTGKRLIQASTVLKENGVLHIFACCTHAVLSGDVQAIQDSFVDEVVLTDSIFIPEEKRIPKLIILSIAPLLSEAIRRIHNEEPLGQLFGVDVDNN